MRLPIKKKKTHRKSQQQSSGSCPVGKASSPLHPLLVLVIALFPSSNSLPRQPAGLSSCCGDEACLAGSGLWKLQAFLTCWFGLLLLFSLERKQGMTAHRGLWNHHKRGRGAGGGGRGGRQARLGTPPPLRRLIKSRRTSPVRAKAGGGAKGGPAPSG